MFTSTNKKFKAATFNMSHRSDVKKYEDIHQKVLEGEKGWNILGEKDFTDEMGDYYIFMKWTRPEE